MLTLETRLDPNDDEVAAKVIDGEAVLVNLSNGMYYSLEKAAGLAWTLIAARYSLDEVAHEFVARYVVSIGEARQAVQGLAEELLRENLVRPPSSAVARRQPEGLPDVPSADQKLPYEKLELNIYRDMGDLLALDPPMPELKDIPWKDPAKE